MNILIIGTNRGAHYELIRLGHKVTVLSKRQTAELGDINTAYFHLLLIDAESSDSLYLAIARALHEQEHFDSVHSFHDGYQILTHQIANDLGVKCLNSPEATKLLNDKFQARCALHAVKLSKLKNAVAQNYTQFKQLIESDIIPPCVVKPINGTGSESVFKLNDTKQRYMFENAEYPLLIEQFASGTEFSVEAFSEDGEHRLVAVVEKFKNADSLVEQGHLVPARLSASKQQVLMTYVAKVLQALNIQNGPTHTEVMFDGDSVEFIESHTRTGGDEIPHLVRYATGIDLYQLEALQVSGESVLATIPDTVSYSCYAAIWYKNPELIRSKRIKDIKYKKELLAKEVIKLELEKNNGDLIGPVKQSGDRVAYAIAVHKDAETALESAKSAIDNVNITFSN